MDIKKMIRSYAEWLESEISTKLYGEYTEITTPYLDRFNDYLQIYVKQDENGMITLSDDGYIIGNLISSGLTFRNGSKRTEALNAIIRNYNLTLDGEIITTTAFTESFPKKKHLMVGAMLAIDDLFIISGESIKSFFLEDIETYFRANDIYYARDFSLQGKTGNLYTYDFHIQRTKARPERFCKGINRLSSSNRDLTLFNWIDTKDKRGDSGELIVMLNDTNEINYELLTGFYNYGIETVLFSQRQNPDVLSLFAS